MGERGSRRSEEREVPLARVAAEVTLTCTQLLSTMKRNRLQMQSDSDDEEVVLSDDEMEELQKDAAAYVGTRYGGRSEKVLQNNIVRKKRLKQLNA